MNDINMEDSNLYPFSSLVSKLLDSFGSSQLPQEELLQLIIRSQRKRKGCGDLFLSFVRQDQENVRLCIDGNIVINLSHVTTGLPVESSKWSIPVSTSSFTDTALILNFNRKESFKNVLQNVLSSKEQYGRVHRSCQEEACIRYNVHSKGLASDLSETRVAMAAKVVGNLLQATGHKIEINPKAKEEQSIKEYFFTYKSTDENIPSGSTRITCGVILNSETGCREQQKTADDYFRHWENIISSISQERDTGKPEEIQSAVNAHIAQAAVLFDLLGIKLGSSISLKMPTLDDNQCYGVSSKGAPFVLYNTARLASITSQFSKKVNTGSYPALPPLDQIDMTLLSSEEEWSLLLHFVMIYPEVIKESLSGLNSGKPNVHNFVAFINAFCKEISVYYRRVRILTEPRSQLIPTMFARLYLLQAVQQVLHNALDILGVKPLLHM